MALGECRGVRNGWVRELLQATPCGRCIVTLDLSSCTGLTDTCVCVLLRRVVDYSAEHGVVVSCRVLGRRVACVCWLVGGGGSW